MFIGTILNVLGRIPNPKENPIPRTESKVERGCMAQEDKFHLQISTGGLQILPHSTKQMQTCLGLERRRNSSVNAQVLCSRKDTEIEKDLVRRIHPAMREPNSELRTPEWVQVEKQGWSGSFALPGQDLTEVPCEETRL
jgi:hypothetical protein